MFTSIGMRRSCTVTRITRTFTIATCTEPHGLALDGIVGREDGKIPRKYRELIAVAVAHTTQCVYCIEVHTKNAKKAGASKEEVVEAVLLAAALRAGGAAAHGTLAMKFYDQA